jgi:ASC-1-like (ASCH) protein
MNISMTCHLNEEPYNLIESGTKTIELRLYDEKRQKIKVGDTIEFINRVTEEKIYTKVKALHLYDSFTELYKHFDKVSLGYRIDEEANPSDMEKYYPLEEQEKYGVVGIELEKV